MPKLLRSVTAEPTAASSDRKQVLNFGGESDYVRLGSFRDIIFRHDENQTIRVESRLPDGPASTCLGNIRAILLGSRQHFFFKVNLSFRNAVQSVCRYSVVLNASFNSCSFSRICPWWKTLWWVAIAEHGQGFSGLVCGFGE